MQCCPVHNVNKRAIQATNEHHCVKIATAEMLPTCKASIKTLNYQRTKRNKPIACVAKVDQIPLVLPGHFGNKQQIN